MIAKLFSWIKNNKLIALLLLILTFLLFKPLLTPIYYILQSRSVSREAWPGPIQPMSGISSVKIAPGIGGAIPEIYPPQEDYAPQPAVEDRLVIEESYLSLLVKDVVSVRKQIVVHAQSQGGYMVSSQVSSPEEAPSATVIIRVPSETLEQTLDYLRSLAVKVVSENLTGQDVTDQYVDYDKRIVILEKTKAKFEEILIQAREISDITNLNREIINIQNQIDSLKGQQEGLSKRAQMAKLAIYLSTDEISLPYAPSETFRPNVIFKLAVRSLVGNLRKVAKLIIWIGVYAMVWVPILLLIWWYRKSRQNITIKK